MAAAGNGKQALDMIPEARPDLILLDVMMPGLDGFEVCEQLKKDPETKDIPVIFLTARVDTTDVIKGFDLGAVDYVTKPFKGAELLSRIKTHLELKFARESLKELNATKDKLFSIIAHDLRNPLQVLMFSADLLSRNYDDYDENKKKEFIRKIFIGTNQLSDLLDNLLGWARSQRGIIETEIEKIHISTLAEENVTLFKDLAEKKNVRLTSEVDSGYYAFADRNMVHIIIRNLVSNAIKFTPTGGEVKITASANFDSMQICVVDTGVGIPAEDISNLFRIDKQKTTLGTAKEKGSGLGLILCKEFAEKNHGTIDVTSIPGEGSSFKVSLPLRPPE